jgi:serine/threonine protein kinase
MPAPATVPEFVELVRKSGLVPADKLDELLSRHRTAGSPQTVDQAAALLARDSLLTYFQAKQIKFGRYKRFTIGSKYRLLELIGAGGMGAVYLCEHTFMKRLVALKVLPTDKLEDQSNLERFYREARAVAALDHPNIVRAYDIDQYEKLHFLVMEYVDGHSLQEIVARYAMERKLFDPVRAAHYVAQAAVGMQHAHELGMVHRDIKPGNLLLDRTGVIKVLDMGLARFFNKQQDSVTEKYDDKCVLGTADYLAPEQAVTNMVDVRADIYSLGGTLYFLLTGQTPFPDGTVAAKLVAHQTREPQPVEDVRPDVPAGILAVLRKMMAKRPEDRYQQPIEVAEALAEWAEQPISPPPDREMPHLCPLVQALMGPSAAERSGVPPSLSRVLFPPGRGAPGRGSSAGARLPDFATPAKPATRYASSNGSGLKTPISTGRASAAPTAPLPPAVPGSGAMKTRPRPRPEAVPALGAAAAHGAGHLRWIIAAGVALVILCVASVVVAYQLGKGSGKAGETSPAGGGGPKPPGARTARHPAPGPRDRIFAPEKAAEHAGEQGTVEFRVFSVSNTDPPELGSGPAKEFAVRFSPEFFESGGPRNVRGEYAGKKLRVRGDIERDPGGGAFILVHDAEQIVTVEDN